MFAYFACITCLCLKFYSGNFNHHHHYNHHHYHYRHHHWCHCHCQILNLFNLTIKTKYHTLMIQKIYDFCHFCFYYHYDHHYHYHHHHWCHCHCQILNLFDLTIKTRYHTWCFKRFMIFVVVVVVVVDVIVIIIVVICRYYLDLLPCKIWRFPNFRQEIRQSQFLFFDRSDTVRSWGNIKKSFWPKP